ncbi:MAG: redox-sensing transcriptional repressor Rex, partial [Hominenteromicrobium sp.]
MQKKPYISMSVIRRLPRYYRFLVELDRRGILRVSSKELAEKMGFTASQVRQDFNCFGGYGQQGYGYAVHQLREEIGAILGINRVHKCILIGAGNLGKAIATHISYNFSGFRLVGIFDSSSQVIGQPLAGLRVLPYGDLRAFCAENKPVMA